MMKKFLSISVLIISILVFSTPVLAAECTDKELDSLETLSKKIEISHEFKGEREGNYLFYVTAYNLSNKFYLQLPNGMQILPSNSSEFLGSFYNNNKFNIEIYASNKTNCQDEMLLTIPVTLPKFNEYSIREECADNKNLNVCKEWYDSSEITEEKFKEMIDKNENVQQPSSDNGLLDMIIRNRKAVFVIFTSIILILVVIKVVRDKKRIKIDF